MALTIATNSAALNSQRMLNSSQSSLNKAMERLSSGMRINRAADDAAGLAITTKQSAQIRSLNQAVRNANDGISMIQTAESGMDAVQNMLTRMKELATQGATDTLSSQQREYLAMEINELREEINNVAGRTQFNGIKLLNGEGASGMTSGGTQVDDSSAVKVGTSTAGDEAFFAAINVVGANPSDTFTFEYGQADIDNDGSTDTYLRLSATDSGDVQTLNLNKIKNDAIATGERFTLNFDKLGVSVSMQAMENGKIDDITAAMDALVLTTGGSPNPLVDISGDLRLNAAVGTDEFTVKDIDVHASEFALGTTANTYTFADAGGGKVTLTDLDGTAQTIDVSTITGVEYGQTVTLAFDKLGVSLDFVSAASGTLAGADLAASLDGLTLKTQVGVGAGGAGSVSGQDILIQAGAASGAENQISLSFTDVRTSSLGNLNTLIDGLRSGSREAYEALMDEAEVVLDTVSTARGVLGSQMNRLEYTIASLESMSTNMSDARMRIRDADFAAETAELSKNQVLQQAGMAMLSQANQMPQNVMALLR